MMNATVIPAQTQEMKLARARLLVRLIYVQALFLSLAYAAGVFTTFNVFGASITTPQVIGHGILASSFGVATALVALIAGIQGMRRVSIYNFVLFVVAVIGGASGFAFLGSGAGFTTYETTNMLMTAVMAVGMPVTGVSLAIASKGMRSDAGRETGRRIPLVITYSALGALALTVIAGTGMTSTPFPSIMKTVHFAFAGLTLAMVVALVMATIKAAVARASQSLALFVTGLLLLQVLTVTVLWALNVVSVPTTNAFALLLAANLVVFATISHIYRISRGSRTNLDHPPRTPLDVSDSGVARPHPDGRHKVPFSFISLIFIATAIASGAMFLYFGGITYIMVMADFAILVYAFLLLGIELP